MLFRKEHCYTAFYLKDPTVLQRMRGPGTAATSSALSRAQLHNRLQEATSPPKAGAGLGEDHH